MGASKLIAQMNEEQRRAERARAPDRLVADALALGDEAVEAFAQAEGCSRATAQRRLRIARQRGRVPSRVLGGG